MQHIANVKIPEDYKTNPVSAMITLADLAGRLRLARDNDHAGHTQEFTHGVVRSKDAKTIRVVEYIRPYGSDNEVTLAEFSFTHDITYGTKVQLVRPVEDPELVLRVFREVLVKVLWGEEKNFVRPVYPEPQCYTLEPDPQGGVPTRKIHYDWLNWYIANDYPGHPNDGAFKKILEAEFAEPDRASKEAKFDTFRDGSCILVEIYHVTRERV